MVKLFKDFWYEEDAMGTVEIVIIIAVLVAIAIIFKDSIYNFASDMMKKVFTSDNANVEKDKAPVYGGGG